MSLARTWQAYPASYRAKEMAVLMRCILAGESGSVIGLSGAGKSNLLGFLCHRPDVLHAFSPHNTPSVVPVLVDFNNLPSNDLAMLFRVILRALYEARQQLAVVDESLAQTAELYYRRVEEKTDPFLSQSALREVLYAFRDRNTRLVLVLDPFEPFCRSATSQVLDNVRGLRDSFKDTLSYVVGLRKELAGIRDPADMGELYEILDMHKCYIGAMTPEDARWVIDQVKETTGYAFSETQAARLAELSGAYPSLLRATSMWLTGLPSPPEAEWTECLLAEPSVQYRLEELWTGLEEDEQRALSAVGRLPSGRQSSRDGVLAALRQQHDEALVRLSNLGLCEARGERWYVCSELLARYASDAAQQTMDEILLNEETGELTCGQVPLTNLTPLEYEALLFFVRHPQVRHTKIDLILNAWPNDPCPLERTDDSIYQVIRGLRRKIEPNPSKPRYIVTWRGTQPREGGYQFFPQGQ